MAQSIQLKHKNSGVLKTGYYGFSWTTLFFGCFPALFRGDFLTFIGTFAVLFLIAVVTYGVGAFIAMFLWAFFYNGYYTKGLLEKGYVFSDFQQKNEAAARALGVAIPLVEEPQQKNQPAYKNTPQSSAPIFKKEEKLLSNDAYKIFLVKKYPLEFNEVLKKYIFKDKLFETVDDALVAAHELEVANDLVIQENKIYYRDKDEAISFLGLKGFDVRESDSGKITVTSDVSTEYFYSESDFLQYANKKANELKK
jgi:hypothetical protein